MAKAAAKGMLHILAIVAVILIIGGLAFMAYRPREGASGSNSCVDVCKHECSRNARARNRKYEGGCGSSCATCCSKHPNAWNLPSFKSCMTNHLRKAG